VAPLYAFTAAETARLTIYRSAIQAGFYSDQLAPRRRSVATTGGGSDSLGGTTVARQPASAAQACVIAAQLAEWHAPQRR
jgi:hypothetical protein